MDAQVPFSPWMFLTGRQVRGTYFGGKIEFTLLLFYYNYSRFFKIYTKGWKSRDQVPELVDQYVKKEPK